MRYERLDEYTEEITRYVKERLPQVQRDWGKFPNRIAHIHSEASEAFEKWLGVKDGAIGEELADLILMLVDTIDSLGYSPRDLVKNSDCIIYLSYRVMSSILAMIGAVNMTVTRSYEAWRDGKKDTAAICLASTIRTVYDFSDIMKVDLDAEIKKKMLINWSRPINHGRPQV